MDQAALIQDMPTPSLASQLLHGVGVLHQIPRTQKRPA
jgi:hypothetical protein